LGATELQARIEETERQIQNDYTRTLQRIQKLKNKMNELEQRNPKTRDLKALDLAIKRLNKLTDSQILRSKKAWAKYRKIEEDCKQCTLRPAQLDNLRATCKKTEELAADLLCYSLARFEQRAQSPEILHNT